MILDDPDNPLPTSEVAQPDKDARFSAYRVPRTERARRLTADIVGIIRDYEGAFGVRARRRKAKDKAIFMSTATAIISNAIHCDLLMPLKWVAVPCGKAVLGRRPTRYRPSLPKTLPYLLDVLTKGGLEFIEVRKGTRGARGLGSGRLTTFRAAPKLRRWIEDHGLTLADFGQSLDQETIVLKARKVKGKAESLDYKDDDRLCAEREALARINRHLAAADVSVNPNTLAERVDPSDRLLRRYYNNGSFDQGGRLFGGFWQSIPKERRQGALRIDGEPIVVLDYTQMGIRLLYALEGLPAPAADAYMPPAPGYYWHPSLPYWPREGMKKVLNAMLCRMGPLEKMPRETRPLFHARKHLRKVKASEVAAALLRHHEAVRHRFFTGYGLRLMRAESDVLIALLHALNGEGITALPIHDAVIVAARHRDRTAQLMRDVFRKVTGGEVDVREELNTGTTPAASPASLPSVTPI